MPTPTPTPSKASPSAPRTAMVRVGVHDLRVRRSGEGPPLLLLNGLGAPLELWGPLVGRLPNVTAIAYDAPGSGGSSAPLLPMSIRDHARIALRLLDEIGVDTTDVLGFSMGGMVAQELALLAGARVRRLVLASTCCGWGGLPGSPAALLAVATPSRYYSRSLFETLAPAYVGGRESADRTFLRTHAKARAAHPPSVLGYAYQVLAATTWSSLCRLPQLRQPTLVLTGDADPLVPPGNAEIMAGLMPAARLHRIRGGGHLCLLEQADAAAPRIAEFLGAGTAADGRAEIVSQPWKDSAVSLVTELTDSAC